MDEPLDWGQWFAVALPVSAVSILLVWVLLLASYRPTRTLDGEELVIKEIRPTKERFSPKQYWVTFVCLVTIALWCVEKEIENVVGDMGIIAIIPIVAFFSTGVLRKVDRYSLLGVLLLKGYYRMTSNNFCGRSSFSLWAASLSAKGFQALVY